MTKVSRLLRAPEFDDSLDFRARPLRILECLQNVGPGRASLGRYQSIDPYYLSIRYFFRRSVMYINIHLPAIVCKLSVNFVTRSVYRYNTRFSLLNR